MICSNDRKKVLCKWLKENDRLSYQISLKLQHFLFFYECASSVIGEEPDFSHLKCYENGPVFSQVWEDYTKENIRFNEELDNISMQKMMDNINGNLAESIDFFIRTCTTKELTDITHEMNMWKVKTPRGDDEMVKEDFSDSDQEKVRLILEIFSVDFVRNMTVIPYGDKNFVMTKKDASDLTPEQMDVLYKLSSDETLTNPVYINIEDGVLEID